MATVVTTGPLTSVKEQATGNYAHALARRGFAAVAFDHRTFGESDGAPRQFENPEGKARDVSAAGAHRCGADPRTERSSRHGRRHLCRRRLHGAGRRRRLPHRLLRGRGRLLLRCANSFATSSPREYQAAIDRGRRRGTTLARTRSAETIEAVARDGGDVAMPLQEAFEFYGTPRGAVPNYVNGFAVQSLAYTTPFDTQEAAARIRVPFLLVHSEHALVPPLAHAFYAAVAGSKSELWLESVGQIDFYDDPQLIGLAADAIAEHFATELP